MRHYETLFIINPELTEEDITITVDKFSNILTGRGAMIGKVDLWGRRKMAYEINKFSKGYFVLFDYGATPEVVIEIERNFKIDENIIRFLTIKKTALYDPERIAEDKVKFGIAEGRSNQEILEENKKNSNDEEYEEH